MIQIENTLVSFDVFEKKFCCDIAACRGACCVEGDSGAPLKEEEVLRIEQEYEQIKPYMKPEGIKAIEEQDEHNYSDTLDKNQMVHQQKITT